MIDITTAITGWLWGLTQSNGTYPSNSIFCVLPLTHNLVGFAFNFYGSRCFLESNPNSCVNGVNVNEKLFFAEKHVRQTLLCLYGATFWFLSEMLQKCPEGPKRFTILDPFEPLWNVDKPAMFGHLCFFYWCVFLGHPVLSDFHFNWSDQSLYNGAVHSVSQKCRIDVMSIRDGLPKKNSCSFGFCPNEVGGGGRALPKFFVHFSQTVYIGSIWG